MATGGWTAWWWTLGPWGAAADEGRVAEWAECLALVERFYARLAAAWGLAIAAPTREERLAAARFLAATGARPAVVLARSLGAWA